jgi:Beta-ketoacyl synthase, N-terminal domain
MSSSGPVKIPVGAWFVFLLSVLIYSIYFTPVSATALQSLEIACDTILSGKAKVMIAGGFDDLSEEGSYEFANMKATSNAETEFAMGREPTEMSRPTTTTRAGVGLSSLCPNFMLIPAVHGSARYWGTHRHECQNSIGAWCPDSWYHWLHVDVHVCLIYCCMT